MTWSALEVLASATLLLGLSAVSEAVPPAVLGGLLACTAPLLRSRSSGDFHLHHHVVRLVLVGTAVGCFAWVHS